MELVISIGIFFIILIIFLPFKKLFPGREMRKFLKGMNVVKANVGDSNSLIENILIFNEKLFKILPVKLNKKRIDKINERIILSGIQNINAEKILGTKIFCLFISLIIFGLFFLASGKLLILVLMSVASLLMFYYPDIILISRIRLRKLQIQSELPVILNTLAIVTEAGLSLNEAFKKVSNLKEGILAIEFGKVIDELSMGVLFKDALQKMAERCKVNELDAFVFLLLQSIEKGSSGVTKVLKSQAKEAWEKRKSLAREIAEKASLKLFLPMMLFAFPSYLIFILGPSIISIIKFLMS